MSQEPGRRGAAGEREPGQVRDGVRPGHDLPPFFDQMEAGAEALLVESRGQQAYPVALGKGHDRDLRVPALQPAREPRAERAISIVQEMRHPANYSQLWVEWPILAWAQYLGRLGSLGPREFDAAGLEY